MSTSKLVLIILDGFGYSEKIDNNAIAKAHTPTWDRLFSQETHSLIDASGLSVGLPQKQMGNSEVGHMHIGAGRIIEQDYTRINHAIDDNTFFTNDVFLNAINKAKANNKAIHLLGLLSDGGVHSHQEHLFALLELFAANHFENAFIHAFLDGRDTPPQSALDFINTVEKKLAITKSAKLASITGRYYAMDRDTRWDRIEKTYQLLCKKIPSPDINATDAINLAYEKGIFDEFILPTALNGFKAIDDGDIVLFFNFRADRARQLTQAFIDKNFTAFKRPFVPALSDFISLTTYAKQLKTTVAYPPMQLKNTVGECIARAGLRQLRLAETEKYAHVTFFFNGGIETVFANEKRELIPSPKCATYDLMPEMSAKAVCQTLCDYLINDKTDVIICNFANADMVGHTGNFNATVKAIECLDGCLTQIVQTIKTIDGELLITADHGNAERMYNDQTKQAHTAHTAFPVPFVHVGRKSTINNAKGSLIDIAPTLLYLLGIKQPLEMTGKSLVL